MKKVILCTLFLLIGNITWCQSTDTIKIPTSRPVKLGYVLQQKDTKTSSYVDPIDGVAVYTFNNNYDSVFSLSTGIVIGVRQLEDQFLCIIETGETIYVYTGLNSTGLKKGNHIKERGYVGEMGVEDDKKQIRVIIKCKNKVLNFEKHLYHIFKYK